MNRMLSWNKLDLNICNSESFTNFKGNIFNFIRPSENNLFLCNNPKGIQLVPRLKLGLRIHLGLIFGKVMLCSTLRISVA